MSIDSDFWGPRPPTEPIDEQDWMAQAHADDLAERRREREAEMNLDLQVVAWAEHEKERTDGRARRRTAG